MKEVYQNEEDTNVVGDMLDALVREGARRMLAAGLEEEVVEDSVAMQFPLRLCRGHVVCAAGNS